MSHDNEDGFESIVMEVKGGQKMRMTMNTSAVMEKAHAAKLMYGHSPTALAPEYSRASQTPFPPLPAAPPLADGRIDRDDYAFALRRVASALGGHGVSSSAGFAAGFVLGFMGH